MPWKYAETKNGDHPNAISGTSCRSSSGRLPLSPTKPRRLSRRDLPTLAEQLSARRYQMTYSDPELCCYMFCSVFNEFLTDRSPLGAGRGPPRRLVDARRYRAPRLREGLARGRHLVT